MMQATLTYPAYILKSGVRMKIYTSYFARLKYLPSSIVPISICGKAPTWYKGLEYKKLAPKYKSFIEWKESHDNVLYIECYKLEVLDKLGKFKVIDDLMNLSNGKDVALICYEKPGDFCHRHLVAKWLECGVEEYAIICAK
jgi:hypothetical protein